jgi:hypothetical protein
MLHDENVLMGQAVYCITSISLVMLLMVSVCGCDAGTAVASSMMDKQGHKKLLMVSFSGMVYSDNLCIHENVAHEGIQSTVIKFG